MADVGHVPGAAMKEEQHGLDLGSSCDAYSGSNLVCLLDWPEAK